jgi:hypothetical protein
MTHPLPRRRGAIALGTIAALSLLGAGLAGGTMLASAGQANQPGARQAPPGGGGQPDLGAMLIQGLRSTPGCLGADAAQTMSGRNTIIGWFEDKAAAMAWYEHPMHQRMMGGMADGDRSEPPMAHVPDDIPLMIMATITPSERPEIPGFPGPIKQISIELFTPVPGGAMINGRLSPEGFKVAHMKNYSAPAGGAGSGTANGG